MGTSPSKKDEHENSNTCSKCENPVCKHMHLHVIKVVFNGCKPSQEVQAVNNGLRSINRNPFDLTNLSSHQEENNHDHLPMFFDQFVLMKQRGGTKEQNMNDTSSVNADMLMSSTNEYIETPSSSDYIPKRLTTTSSGGAKDKDKKKKKKKKKDDEDDEEDEDDEDEGDEEELNEELDEEEDEDQSRFNKLDLASELTLSTQSGSSSDVYNADKNVNTMNTSSTKQSINQEGYGGKKVKKTRQKKAKGFKRGKSKSAVNNSRDSTSENNNSEISSVLTLPKYLLESN
jgi:hypothetical protein